MRERARKKLVFIVLVSELMLQQTQVATVIRYYETWMKVDEVVFMYIHKLFRFVLKQWPNVKSLAEASEDVR